MSFRHLYRVLSTLAVASAAVTMWGVLPSAPAFAEGTGFDGKCSGWPGDPDCWHYVGMFKTRKDCLKKGDELTLASQVGSGKGNNKPLQRCEVTPPSGHLALYIFDSACKADVPYSKCPRVH